MGSYPIIKPETGFALGIGKNTQNRKNLFEIDKNGRITSESINVKNSNGEASYVSQDCMVLRDIDTGWEYAYQMKSGALVTILLPTHIEVTKLPDKLEYEQGQVLDTSGIEVMAFYPDGSAQKVDNIDVLPINDKSYFYKLGQNTAYVRAKLPLSYTAPVVVNVIKYDYETKLIDFNYTIRDDGTILLDSWKQTLNGQPSTEMIIPNNGLIVI